MKDKKKIIILSLIVIIVVVSVIYFFYKKNSIVFYLNGDEHLSIKYGSNYIDSGFVAEDGLGNDLSNNVNVINPVNTFTSGVYRVVYELNYNNHSKTLERIITVEDITGSDLEIKLIGSEETYILKGTDYDEEGVIVYNKYDNSVFNDVDVTITSNVNSNIVGEYNVYYQLDYNGSQVTATRKVIVIDISDHLTPETLTSGKVKISLDLSNVSNYSYTKLPDNYTILNKNVEYEVSSNGDYTFIIVLSNKEQIKKIVTVDNIVDNYICSGEITTYGTKLEVKPTNNDVIGYEWVINNETIKGTNTYNKAKIIKNAMVNLLFKDNKKYQVNCSISDKLLYHFKYDANDTKEHMKCNTYTSEDKIRLDAILKQVVNEAGYGTRAGVVAAARFLVGGLDYKVKYLGPKQVNSALGRYQKVGLNIGQNGAWGCNVSGWTQGMDCTNFVLWAFYQNGITTYPYSYTRSDVRDVLNTLRAGDLLYVPCNTATCKNDYKLNHVGIIIGIDGNDVYVAESVSSKQDGIVVNKYLKNELYKNNFKLAKIYNYASDGNYTGMWMSE